MAGHRKIVLEPYRDFIIARIEETPHLTLHGLKDLLAARGVVIPAPYSPDMNPIEQTSAKLKHLMRMAQRRTIEETWRYLGRLIATVTPEECANYLQNAGYVSAK